MDFNRAEVGVLFKKIDHGAILPSSEFLPYCLIVLGHSLMGAWDKTPLPHLQNGSDSRTQLMERIQMEYLVQCLAHTEHSVDIDYNHTLKKNSPNILPLNILPIFQAPLKCHLLPLALRIVLGLDPCPCSASDTHYLASCALRCTISLLHQGEIFLNLRTA